MLDLGLAQEADGRLLGLAPELHLRQRRRVVVPHRLRASPYERGVSGTLEGDAISPACVESCGSRTGLSFLAKLSKSAMVSMRTSARAGCTTGASDGALKPSGAEARESIVCEARSSH